MLHLYYRGVTPSSFARLLSRMSFSYTQQKKDENFLLGGTRQQSSTTAIPPCYRHRSMTPGY